MKIRLNHPVWFYLFLICFVILLFVIFAKEKNISAIFNIISIVAAAITIASAILTGLSLEQTEQFQIKQYHKENCKVAIEKLGAILNILNSPNPHKSKYLNIIKTHIGTILKNNKILEKECIEYLEIINKAKYIKKDNVKDIVTSIEFIIALYRKGE